MTKTPSSLKWLIIKRARLLGTLNNNEDKSKYLAEAKRRVHIATLELKEAKADLTFKNTIHASMLEETKKRIAAIDLLLEMHEIQIDPITISPIKTHERPAKLKYGNITKGIYECLKISGRRPVQTHHITLYILNKNDLNLSRVELQRFQNSVRKRLQKLCSDKKINRHHDVVTTNEGRWTLA